MKYDFSRCNNLNFRLDDGTTGFIKVCPNNNVFLYSGKELKWDIIRAMPTFNMIACLATEEFAKAYIEKHDLEIIPRDPETYTDWKVGDRVMDKDTGGISTIAAKLGDIVFLLNDNNAVTSTCTARLTKYYTLVLTDYEKELIHAQELEKKKECPFKEGDKVLVRDLDTSWRFDVFQHYEENACYSYECLGSEYEQCIPLNEHTWKLLGTTDEYKEEE
jgi:hypothetical protein